MKRNIFFLIVGGILIIGGQFSLSLGVHPDRGISNTDSITASTNPLSPLLQGSLGLVIGSVLVVSGLLGMADGYQRQAGRLGKLLESKLPFDSDTEIDSARDPTAVNSSGDLGRYNKRFWQAYLRTAAALCLFMAGTLALTAAFVDASFFLFSIVLTSGTCIIALLAGLVGLPGLQCMRRAHSDLTSAAEVYANQPEMPDTDPEPAIRQPRRAWRSPRRRPVDQVARRVNIRSQPAQITVRHYD